MSESSEKKSVPEQHGVRRAPTPAEIAASRRKLIRIFAMLIGVFFASAYVLNVERNVRMGRAVKVACARLRNDLPALPWVEGFGAAAFDTRAAAIDSMNAQCRALGPRFRWWTWNGHTLLRLQVVTAMTREEIEQRIPSEGEPWSYVRAIAAPPPDARSPWEWAMGLSQLSKLVEGYVKDPTRSAARPGAR